MYPNNIINILDSMINHLSYYMQSRIQNNNHLVSLLSHTCNKRFLDLETYLTLIFEALFECWVCSSFLCLLLIGVRFVSLYIYISNLVIWWEFFPPLNNRNTHYPKFRLRKNRRFYCCRRLRNRAILNFDTFRFKSVVGSYVILSLTECKFSNPCLFIILPFTLMVN